MRVLSSLSASHVTRCFDRSTVTAVSSVPTAPSNAHLSSFDKIVPGRVRPRLLNVDFNPSGATVPKRLSPIDTRA